MIPPGAEIHVDMVKHHLDIAIRPVIFEHVIKLNHQAISRSSRRSGRASRQLAQLGATRRRTPPAMPSLWRIGDSAD
jgi:hypothetical protein